MWQSLPAIFYGHNQDPQELEGFGYVSIIWFRVDNANRPVAPYATLIAHYNRLDHESRQVMHDFVDEHFTADEIRQLADYLDTAHGWRLAFRKEETPVRYTMDEDAGRATTAFRSGVGLEGGSVKRIYYRLSDEPGYRLPFTVWGYVQPLSDVENASYGRYRAYLQTALADQTTGAQHLQTAPDGSWRLEIRHRQTSALLYTTQGDAFSRPDLRRVASGQADLYRANLHGARLAEADLNHADLRWADLSSTDMSGANLTEADLTGAHLRRAILTGTRFIHSNMSHAALMYATLRQTDLTGADLSQSYLCGAFMGQASLIETSLTNADLRQTNLFQAKLNRVDLRGADLTHAIIGGTEFTACTTLHHAIGLETIRHTRPSKLDEETLSACVPYLPDLFLKGVGYTDREIRHLHARYREM